MTEIEQAFETILPEKSTFEYKTGVTWQQKPHRDHFPFEL